MKCPQCSNEKHWRLADGRFKCRRCRKSFSDPRKRVRISQDTLNRVLEGFLLEIPTKTILEDIDISRYMLLKILTLLRMGMTRDLSPALRDVLKVDEAYLTGRKRTRWSLAEPRVFDSDRDYGTIGQTVFGILYRKGAIWAEPIVGIKAAELSQEVVEEAGERPFIYSGSKRIYAGFVTKYWVYFSYLRDYERYPEFWGCGETVVKFWEYLKRKKFFHRRGVRKDRLQLYLGEYVWRYNKRKFKFKRRKWQLERLIYPYIRSG